MTGEQNLQSEVEVKQNSSVRNIAMSHGKEIVSAVVIGVIVTVISTVILNGRSSSGEENLHYENIDHSQQAMAQTNRVYFIRSQLSQVLAMVSTVKMHLTEYYMMEGSFPKTSKDFNILHLDLNESDLIDESYLIESGVGVSLSQKFGEDKSLFLIASPSKNNAYLKWRCETNIEPKFLGMGSRTICEFNPELQAL